MSMEFKLPDLGEGIHEGEIVDVLVAVGDKVEDGTLVLIVETDKATTEIPSPVAGMVKEIRVRPGDVVKVGQVMMVFEEAAQRVRKREEKQREKAAPGAEAVLETGELKPDKSLPGKEKKQKEADVSGPAPSGPVPAAPSTRRLARELGVDLKRVKPSGPGGRVMSEDVKAFVEKSVKAATEPQKARESHEHSKDTKAPEAPSAPETVKVPEVAKPALAPAQTPPSFALDGDEPVERMPLRSIRKATAKNMALAWSQIPHVTHQDAADITDLEAFRKKHKEKIRVLGGALSLTVLVLKAAVAALKAFPNFNSSIDMEAQEILIKKHYHMGVAVDTPRGLIVPVVRHVDRKSITELAFELPELVRRTREGKIEREDLSGGTFTLTNIGALGGHAFTPIVNYPQAAILGLAQARLEPVIQGDISHYKIVPRLVLPLMLGFDHRLADGAEAAHFLNLVKDALQDPENLLMVM